MENRVIGLEGVDGSGKTTVGKVIADQVGGRYLYCMDGNPLRSYRDFFDRQPPLIRFVYYIVVPLMNYEKVEQLRQTSDVFLDRTIASTIAYHLAYGIARDWVSLIPQHLLSQIDSMLYFTVSEPERRRRLLQRQAEGSVLTASDLKSLALGVRIDHEYRKVFPDKTIIIDTDNKSPDKIATEVIERIYGNKPSN